MANILTTKLATTFQTPAPGVTIRSVKVQQLLQDYLVASPTNQIIIFNEIIQLIIAEYLANNHV